MTTDRTVKDAAVDGVLAPLRHSGGQMYLGEPVTQLEHALQTAALAERAGAPAALVVAALLHDVGHLIAGERADGKDARHEDVGYRWLADRFGAAVTEPVRLHVAAKRYLCAIEPDYVASLSAASRESLTLQGGPMPEAELGVFEATPWAPEAASLRRWDDAAKVPGRIVPGLAHYHRLIAEALEGR